MPLVSVLVTLIVVGVLLWLFNNYVTTIDPKFKQLVNIVAIIACVLWLLSAFGVFSHLSNVRVGG